MVNSEPPVRWTAPSEAVLSGYPSLTNLMSVEVKIFVAMAPVFLIALAYTLSQADWQGAVLFAFIGLLILVCYRLDKRSRSLAASGEGPSKSDRA